jgi:DNA polymerase theta
MNWGMLAAVLDHMRDRLEAGARADLLEMAQVTFVKSWTARLLRDNGFKNLRALAEADPKDLVPVLMMVWYLFMVSRIMVLTRISYPG